MNDTDLLTCRFPGARLLATHDNHLFVLSVDQTHTALHRLDPGLEHTALLASWESERMLCGLHVDRVGAVVLQEGIRLLPADGSPSIVIAGAGTRLFEITEQHVIAAKGAVTVYCRRTGRVLETWAPTQTPHMTLAAIGDGWLVQEGYGKYHLQAIGRHTTEAFSLPGRVSTMWIEDGELHIVVMNDGHGAVFHIDLTSRARRSEPTPHSLNRYCGSSLGICSRGESWRGKERHILSAAVVQLGAEPACLYSPPPLPDEGFLQAIGQLRAAARLGEHVFLIERRPEGVHVVRVPLDRRCQRSRWGSPTLRLPEVLPLYRPSPPAPYNHHISDFEIPTRLQSRLLDQGFDTISTVAEASRDTLIQAGISPSSFPLLQQMCAAVGQQLQATAEEMPWVPLHHLFGHPPGFSRGHGYDEACALAEKWQTLSGFWRHCRRADWMLHLLGWHRLDLLPVVQAQARFVMDQAHRLPDDSPARSALTALIAGDRESLRRCNLEAARSHPGADARALQAAVAALREAALHAEEAGPALPGLLADAALWCARSVGRPGPWTDQFVVIEHLSRNANHLRATVPGSVLNHAARPSHLPASYKEARRSWSTLWE